MGSPEGPPALRVRDTRKVRAPRGLNLMHIEEEEIAIYLKSHVTGLPFDDVTVEGVTVERKAPGAKPTFDCVKFGGRIPSNR